MGATRAASAGWCLGCWPSSHPAAGRGFGSQTASSGTWLARFIGSTPEATVFQAAYCLVIYNPIGVIRGYVAEDGGVAPEAVSAENLFADVREEMAAGLKMVGATRLEAVVPAEADAARVAGRLRTLLAGSWREGWRKAADKKPRPPRAKRRAAGAHDSVYRLQQKSRAKKRRRAT